MAKAFIGCEQAGCEDRHYAKALCKKHYMKQYVEQNGRPSIRFAPCSFAGCVNAVNSHRLCAAHDRQRRIGQELRPLHARRNVVDGMKVCGDCERTLPLAEFHKDRHRCKSCISIRNRMRQYRLSQGEVIDLSARSSCDVCGAPVEGRNKHVDHCHATGTVRGVLCRRCNWILGQVGDDPTQLMKLALYLRRS